MRPSTPVAVWMVERAEGEKTSPLATMGTVATDLTCGVKAGKKEHETVSPVLVEK